MSVLDYLIKRKRSLELTFGVHSLHLYVFLIQMLKQNVLLSSYLDN